MVLIDLSTETDLFYYPHVFSDPVHFAEHLRFMAALKDETENIQWASVMHRFVGEGLIRNGKLSRWLTQSLLPRSHPQLFRHSS